MWAQWSDSIRRPPILFAAVLALAIAVTGCSGIVSAPNSSQPGPPGPPPSVSGVSPTTGPASGGTLITISGTNFVTNATVLVGGTAATGTSVVGATQVRATTPSHAAGNADVQIRNPDGQAATMAAAFTFQASAQVQISTSSLPSGQVGASYQAALAATGGTGPYSWSVALGALPAGLSLNASTGAISGQPTATGNFPFTIQVRDSSAPQQTATQALSISIAAATPGAPQIVTSNLPGGQVQAAYSATLAASGGTPPYTWSIASGSLPSGLNLAASSGQIAGTPTQSGNFPFTVRVTDTASQTAQQALSISIAASAPQALTITTTSVPPAQVSQPYSVTLQAAGGTPAYTWSISLGSLPAGLSLAPASGQITGTPSVTGQFSFSVRVVDSSSPQQSATASFSVTVSPPSTQPGLDQYGGALLSPCAGGVKTDWYVEKDANKRWWFCTPEGHRMFWQGLYILGRGGLDSANLITKYGSAANVSANWRQDMVLRMKYWGLNAMGEGMTPEMTPISFLGSSPNPQKLPFNHMFRFLTGGGALINRYGISSQPIKSLNIGSGHCNNVAHPAPAPDRICYHSRAGTDRVLLIGPVPDFYDPMFDAYVQGKAQTTTTQAGTYPPDFQNSWNSGTPVGHSWVTGLVPDDSDDMMGVAGPGCGQGTNGNGWAGVDSDCHGHVGLLIATSNPYITMNQGDCTLGSVPCTNAVPSGSTNPYADNVNHTKAAWIAFLKARYNNSISALNTAWNTGGYYTTFDTQAGYPSSITNSTGVNDSDGGTTSGNHAWFGSIDFLNLTGLNAGLKQDLDDFLEQYLGKYYQVVTNWFHTYYPGMLVWTTAPMCGHASGPRDAVIKAAMKYVDVFECEADPHRPAILQHIYQLGCQVRPGCVPVVSTMYITANADSRAQAGGHWDSFRDWATQTARAGNFGDPLVNWGGVLGQAHLATDPVSGDHMVAGIQTWNPTDEGTSRNWGIITTFDNPYDGRTPLTGAVPCPPPASVQTSPTVLCGRDTSMAGLPFTDFVTPIKSHLAQWLNFIP